MTKSTTFTTNHTAEALKFWLMPFVCFASFGFPTRFGGVVSVLSGFAPLCFFILCGYFILTPDQKRNERLLTEAIRRSGVFFAALALVCLMMNLCYYFFSGAVQEGLLAQLFAPRVLFNFFVLCAWPFQMGATVWFIQSLFYSYVLLYLLHRYKILYRRRIYLTLLVICVILMLITGEFAGLVGFHRIGVPYLPPNAITRALPYLLLGGLIRQEQERLRKLGPVLGWALVPVGLVLAYLEFDGLSRMGALATTSHAVGLGLTAFGLCETALVFPRHWHRPRPIRRGRFFARRIYAMSQPLAFLVLVPLSALHPALAAVVQALGGVAVYPLCFLAALAWHTRRWWRRFRRWGA